MTAARPVSEEAIWHDVECGAYAADLAIWSSLAREAAGPVLEIGAGTGRVALRLASEGFDVTGVDTSAPLVEELRRRAAERGLAVEATVADARALELGRRFALIIAPMQVAQLMRGAGGRRRFLGRARAHLADGGSVAIAVLAEHGAASASSAAPPLPDVLERDGFVYSSLPMEVRKAADGLEVRRLRQVVTPQGDLREHADSVFLDELSPATLESEATAAGLAVQERMEVPATADHLGSTIVVLEAA